MTHSKFRRQVLVASGLVLALGATNLVMAQTSNFPNKPIKIIVPFGAGSGADTYARYFGKKISDILGQPVIVENKPGAGGAIAVNILKTEPADGYTMLMGSNSPLAANTVTVKNLPYDPVKDLRPVSGITKSMAVFAVNKDSPIKTVADLEKRGKDAKPMNIGVYSTGYQLAGAQFTSKAKSNVQNIMYKGSGQTVTDLIGGQIDLAVIDSTGSVNMHNGGKYRIVAVTGENRHPNMPNVPTLKESGYPEAVHYSWTAFWVNSQTPDNVTKVLADAMKKALADPESQAFITKTDAEVMALGPDELRKFQLQDIERYKKAAKDSGFQPQ